MNGFDFWTDKGKTLSDSEFARAFAALGILAAYPGKKATGSETTSAQISATEAARALLEESVSAVKTVQDVPEQLIWKFPEPATTIHFQETSFVLGEADMDGLAEKFEEILSKISNKSPFPKLRLCIKDYEKHQPFMPWFRLLPESGKGEIAASLWMNSLQREFPLKWPLRLGYFENNPVEDSLKPVVNIWPSSVNAAIYSLGREHDNCDILFFDGTLQQLDQHLKDSPAAEKAYLIFIRGNPGDGDTNFRGHAQQLMAKLKAGGIVWTGNHINDATYTQMINRLVEGLCHNLPLDFVLTANFSYFSADGADPLIMLTPALAGFRLHKVVDQLVRKLSAMPRKTMIEVSEDTFQRLNLPEAAPAMPASVIKNMISGNRSKMIYAAESTGATGITEMAKSIKKAEAAPVVADSQNQRYLSAKSFIREKEEFLEERRALLTGKEARIIVRIGPEDKEWAVNKTAVPIEKLPPQKEAWTLTIILSESNHIKEPLKQKIKLPQFGASTECAFDFTPQLAVVFEGQLSVVHRGRVIQTAVITIPVTDKKNKRPRKDSLAIKDIIPVRQSLGDLDDRRQFDLALVSTGTAQKRPVLTGISGEHAWLMNPEQCNYITTEINGLLSEVALSVKDYNKGFESEKGKQLLFDLVLNGCELYSAIVESELKRPGNRAEMAKKEYIQIVSTRDEAVIPFEFIYDREVPDDDAVLCSNWKKAVQEGKCPGSCSKDQRKTICPMGFWGLSKVIERHDVTPELSKGGAAHFIQSEVISGRGNLSIQSPVMLASSARVEKKSLDALGSLIKSKTGTDPLRAQDWNKWEELVKSGKPNFILALPHTDGHGANSTLEIGNKTLRSIQVRNSHVRPEESGNYPLVALLGCDTSGSALEYSKYIRQFRHKGAGVVIGTIATVYGEHAASMAGMLVEELNNKNSGKERLGEIIRSAKRNAIAKGLIMGLCLVAFGDADWKITH